MHGGSRRGLLALLLPGLLFLALHVRTIDYGFVWTDVPEIVHGSILRPPGEWLEAFGEPLQSVDDFATRPFTQPYYRPLQVVTASWLDARFGREPRAFRAVTLALGALTAVLFAALARRLLRSTPQAVVAGSAFAVHPAALEIYVWIGGLAAALADAFVLASLLAATAALRSGQRAVRAVAAVASVAALVLGLLSKENAAVLPALLLAIALAWLAQRRREGRPLRPLALRAGGLVGVHVAVVVAYLVVLRPAVVGGSLTGAVPLEGRWSTQWLSSLAFWPEAIAWLFVPLHSSTSDVLRIVTRASDPWALLGIALVVGSGALWLWLLGRGHAAAAVGVAWIWIAFLPTSGVVPLLHARAERNLFLSVFGVALLWPCIGVALRRAGLPRAAAVALAVVALAGLAQRTWARQPDWRSTRTLFARDVADDPRHREGRLNLVVWHADAGRYEEARQHMQILLEQRAPRGWTSYALESNLLEVACRLNALTGHDAETLRAVEARPPAPSVWEMPGFYACWAPALERLGRPAAALAIYEALHAGLPGSAGAPFALGAARCHATLGHATQARAWLARLPPEAAKAPALAPEVEALRRALEPR